jgi:hypothetical protein
MSILVLAVLFMILLVAAVTIVVLLFQRSFRYSLQRIDQAERKARAAETELATAMAHFASSTK